MRPSLQKLWFRTSLLLPFFVIFSLAQAPASDVARERSSQEAENSPGDKADVIAQIRDEGLNRSEVMATLSHLTDVIGPRLTGSPNLKRANEWTRGRLEGWGLTNAHLEAWGPFGRGWSLSRFSAQVIEPQTIPLKGYPSAWSPGFTEPLVAEVVFFDVKTNTDMEKYKGQLKGKIVLASAIREIKPRFEPLAVRLVETNLLQLANAGEPRDGTRRFGLSSRDAASSGTNSAGGTASPEGRRAAGFRGRPQTRNLAFLAKEGAALVINSSSQGDGGTFFVAAASVPPPENSSGINFSNLPRAWSTNVPAIPPQITLATEDYNRLARMAQQEQPLKMEVDLRVKFYDDDLMAYNTVAEIPGKDLKDEIVMLGAHLDSWHSGTGATDNGIGAAAVMEAARILKALKLQPRRTIRVALWSGEEQGLLGSRAYVSRHFGYFTNSAPSTVVRSPKDEAENEPESKSSKTNSSPARRLVRLHEYEKLAAYFNLDNGGGKVRGVYLQGNEAVRPLFRRWLEPFRDLGVETLSLSNTGGTDHIPFDTIGLPAFQFIQDPLDYNSRTHHSNEDVYDRIQAEDAKQAAVMLAVFAWDAATAEAKLPRKAVPEPIVSQRISE